MHLHDTEPHTQTFFTLKEGKTGIFQTCQLMRKLVDEYKTDPVVRGLALHLIEDLPSKDEVGEIDRIFYFVRDCIRYCKDVYNVETLSTPVKVLEVRQGDCDDKSTLLAAMLESVGYGTYFKITGYNDNQYEHVYVFAYGLNISLHLDPTEPEPAGWEAPDATVSAYVG